MLETDCNNNIIVTLIYITIGFLLYQWPIGSIKEVIHNH